MPSVPRLLIAVGVIVLAEGFGPLSACAQTQKVVFSYTGANQTYVVPDGVTTLTVKLWGAGGALSGGAGAFVKGQLAVTPGSTLTFIVGGGGRSFNNAPGGFGNGGSIFTSGGSGGGRSAIQLLGTELVTAAGGGGGGSGAGGGGGLNVGLSGLPLTASTAATGGTQTQGGTGGRTNSNSGGSGGAFQGGSGNAVSGGGGGGGYFGGGGGGQNPGAGGSSYRTSLAFTDDAATSQAGQSGDSFGGTIAQPGGSGIGNRPADADYVLGIGAGGGVFSPDGGNGLIAIFFAVPEPSAFPLLLVGCIPLAFLARRHHARQ